MNKVLVSALVVVMLVLSACGGGSAETVDEEPVAVTDVASMEGLWFRAGDRHKAYVRFNADGTYRMAFERENVADAPDAYGTFWFEDGQFHIEDAGYAEDMGLSDQCPDVVGRYDVVMEGGDKLVFSVADDGCEPRTLSLDTVLGLTRVES